MGGGEGGGGWDWGGIEREREREILHGHFQYSSHLFYPVHVNRFDSS